MVHDGNNGVRDHRSCLYRGSYVSVVIKSIVVKISGEEKMSEQLPLDEIRAAALVRINRSERNFKLFLLAAFIVESLFLLCFLLLADFSNRMHILLLIATVSSYTIVVIGLFALGSHINRSVLRVQQAIELLKGSSESHPV
jgi:hypothetical protein